MVAHSFTDWITRSFSLTYSHPFSLWFPPSHSLPQLLSLTFNPLPLSHLLYPSLGLHSSSSLPLFITLPLLHTFSHSITHSLPNKYSLTLSLSLQLHSLSNPLLFLTHSHSFPLSFIPCLTLPHSHSIFHSLLTHSFTFSLSLTLTHFQIHTPFLTHSLPQNIKAFRSIITMGAAIFFPHI